MRVSPRSVVVNVLDCDILVSSNPSHAITFTLELVRPGGNTPQGTNYTTTCLPSWKLSKLDEPDMQDTAGEAGTSS